MHQRKALVIVSSSLLVAAIAFTATTIVRNSYDASVVRGLLAELSSADPTAREKALSRLSERNVSTLEPLIQLLNAPNPDVRIFAAAHLAEPIPTPQRVIDAFATFVIDEDQPQAARVHALSALGKCGQLADGADNLRRVVAALCAAVTSKDEIIAASAAVAIYHFGPHAKSAIPTLKAALEADSELVRVYSAGTIFQVDPDCGPAVLPVLLAATKSLDNTVVDRALMFLRDFGTESADCIPSLKQLLVEKPELTYQIQDAIDKLESGQITRR